MNKRIFLAAALLALISCTSSTTDSIADSGNSSATDLSSTEEASSTQASSGAKASSGSSAGSSSFTALPDVDSTLIAGPNDLKVSSFVGPTTIVLTWSDIPSLDPLKYTGYKIFRNDNYSGWDSVGIAPPQQQFYKDQSLDTTEYKSLYRIVAYKKRSGKSDTLISKYSNEAGVIPVTSMGFEDIVFDSPSAIAATRLAPSVYDITWAHSGKKPELGFVVQALRYQTEFQPVLIDTGDNALNQPSSNKSEWLTAEGIWYSLDTLGETDNHFRTKGAIIDNNSSTTLFRVYAFYNDEFGSMISEFTDEVASPSAYVPSIGFTPPDLYSNVLSATTVDFSWNPTHFGIDGFLNGYGNPYTDTTYWEWEALAGDTYTSGKLALGVTAKQIIDGPHICSISLRVRLVWVDVYGILDKTPWSPASGTKPGTQGKLTDKGKVCKE